MILAADFVAAGVTLLIVGAMIGSLYVPGLVRKFLRK